MTSTTKRFRALLVTLMAVIATNMALSKMGTIRPSAPRPIVEVAQLASEATAKIGTIRPSGPRP
jgi:hypothetical protein